MHKNNNSHVTQPLLQGGVSNSCISCGKEIRKIYGLPKDRDWEGSWNGGIVERISAGYGSIFDGDMFILAICDECVKIKNLKYVGNYMFPDENDDYMPKEEITSKTEEIKSIRKELIDKYNIKTDRDLIKQLNIKEEDKGKLFTWIRYQCAFSYREGFNNGKDELENDVELVVSANNCC